MAAPYVPGGHVNVSPVGVQTFPRGQSSQKLASGDGVCGNTQGVQAEAPAMDTFPAGHAVHLSKAIWSPYVPAGHAVHWLAEDGE